VVCATIGSETPSSHISAQILHQSSHLIWLCSILEHDAFVSNYEVMLHMEEEEEEVTKPVSEHNSSVNLYFSSAYL